MLVLFLSEKTFAMSVSPYRDGVPGGVMNSSSSSSSSSAVPASNTLKLVNGLIIQVSSVICYKDSKKLTGELSVYD